MPSKLDDYLKSIPKEQQDGIREQGKVLASKTEPIQEADPKSVEQDYEQREGKPLDQNVSGYGQPEPNQPLTDQAKDQAQSVAEKYPSSAEKGEDTAPEQENEQDHER